MPKFIQAFHSDKPFPHVLLYSTSLVIISLAVIGMVSAFVLQ